MDERSWCRLAPDEIEMLARRCRRRRERRAAALAGGMAVVAIWAAVAPGPWRSRAEDGLVPIDTPSAQSSAAPVTPATAQPPRPTRTVPTRPPSAMPEERAKPADPPASSRATARPRPKDGSRLVRLHEPAPNMCTPAKITSAWRRYGSYCLIFELAPTPGRGMHFQLCRGAEAIADTLSFPTDLEVDFVVSRDGTPVWRWSDTHPGRAPGHTLRVGADECYDWTLEWTMLDSAGRPVPDGYYVAAATSQATEVAGAGASTTGFTIDRTAG